MKNRSGANASFKNRLSESARLKKNKQKKDQLLFLYIAVLQLIVFSNERFHLIDFRN